MIFSIQRAVARHCSAWPFAAACAVSSVLFPTVDAAAANSSYITGTVLGEDGKPVLAAQVRVQGQNVVLIQSTDAKGRFTFAAMPIGEYRIDASKGEQIVNTAAALTIDGADLNLRLHDKREIGSVSVSSASYLKRSGTDVTFNRQQIERLPGPKSLPNLLSQLPAAARGSNGQIHLNGDHNGLNYYLDGVQVPANLNRVLGTEIDVSTIGFLDAIQGAYPAQYGDRFATVLNIGTKVNSGPAGAVASTEFGSFGAIDTSLGYHTPLSGGGALSVATRFAQTNRGIDPAVQQFVNNRANTATQFVRLTLPARGRDTYNFDLFHTHQTFQIPPDTASGVSARTDNNERQDDTYASLQYRHAIGTRGSLSFGPSMKLSRIFDAGDPQNDLAPGGGAPAAGQVNCIDFSDCGYFSVRGDRLARDLRWNIDYDLRSERHEIKAGALYATTRVAKAYNVSLQPYSALNPNGVFSVSDTAPNNAYQQELYLQDSWKLGNTYLADYGVRADAFQISSTSFKQGFSQFSPRLKLTRFIGKKASVYAYYGRLFVPFSFENVSPATAAALYTVQNNPGNSFDLKPQRDSLYEVGGHTALGSAELGVRISHKVSSDNIDDTQIGATNLHQDINFPRAVIDIQSVYLQQPLPRNGRMYLSITRGQARNSLNCSTQLLQNCSSSGPAGGPLVQQDHDQRWSITSGILANDRHQGWFSLNAEYGSGLSLGDTSVCPNGNTVNCKTTPHLIFNLEKGIALAPFTTVSFNMQNLLNDRYAITRDSALQGTHFASPRTMGVLFRYSGH